MDMRFANQRNYYFPVRFMNEQWKRISDAFIEVCPYYWVSDTGKVFSELSNIILKPDYVGKGYLKVTLNTTLPPYRHDYLIHRLVLQAFIPISNPHEMTGNHKDGNHENNFLWNLEWATYEEQMEHAVKTQLRTYDGYVDESIVRKICEALEYETDFNIIENIVFGIPQSNREHIQHIHLIKRIYRKISWTSISKYYSFIDHPNINPNQVLTEDQIRKVCSILEINNKLQTRDIYNMIGIDIGRPGDSKYTRYMAAMVYIRNKKGFFDIIKDYNF